MLNLDIPSRYQKPPQHPHTHIHVALTTEWQRNKIVQGSWKDKESWQHKSREEPQTARRRVRKRERSQAVPAQRGSRWFWMSFRGKLQLKPPAWTVHTQMPSPTAHIRKHETTRSVGWQERGQHPVFCVRFQNANAVLCAVYFHHVEETFSFCATPVPAGGFAVYMNIP